MIAYLKLIRLPNVFTSFADIIAGYFLATSYSSSAPRWDAFALACGASAAFYLAGMAFNDIADRDEDSRVRPGRPIPSGAVSLRGAVACALGLMLTGIVLAFLLGRASLIVAVVLAAAILAYDFMCKGTDAGPRALAVCRFSNVLLGMSAVYSMPGAIPVYSFMRSSAPLALWSPLLLPAFASGFFGAGVTAFSAQEEQGAKRSAIGIGWYFTGIGMLFAVMFFGISFSSGWPKWSALGLLPLGVLAWQLISRTRTLMRSRSPQDAQGLVLAGVKGYCVLDAALLLFGFGLELWIPAVVCILLLFPGGWLRKWLMQREA